MATKILKCKIKRQKGYLYYLNKKGNVAKAKMARGKKKNGGSRIVVKAGIKRKSGYLYFVDKQGDVSAARMLADKKRLSVRPETARKVRKETPQIFSDYLTSFLEKKKVEFVEKSTVFLSYSHKDRPIVKDINKYLKKKEVNTWLDADKLKGGQVWKKHIKKAIESCYLFVTFLSHNSVNSKGYFQAEAKQSLEVWKNMPEGRPFIIPVKLDNDVGIPNSLSDFHVIECTTDIRRKKELFETINSYMEQALNY
jgi:hypothetical protein